MNSLIKHSLLMLHLGLLTEGLNLKDNLPVPWRDREACQVDDEYFQEDTSLLTLCDPDGTLPPVHRMITSEMLRHCKENSADDTTFLLLLVNAINHAGTIIKNETAEIDHLMENGVTAYNLTKEESAIFLVVERDPFGVNYWYSDSLYSTVFRSPDLETLLGNLSEAFRDNKNFPLAVNRLVYFFCEKVHAPPYRPARWDALTLLWMILVIIVIALVTGTVIHLIMVRYKAFHKGDAPGELRQHRGRPSLGPLSMEMEDFGATPFQPSRNLLLSTDDVTAVSPQQQTSSTANLLES